MSTATPPRCQRCAVSPSSAVEGCVACRILQLESERDEAVKSAEWWGRATAHAQTQRDEAVAAFKDASRLRSEIQQERIKAETDRDEACSAALAHAIEAERLKGALGKHGQHMQDCAYWSAGGRPGEEPEVYTCTCGLDASLAPAAPGDVREIETWAYETAHAVALLPMDRQEEEGGIVYMLSDAQAAVVEAALVRLLAPSPSPAARLRVTALLACETAVRARTAVKMLADGGDYAATAEERAADALARADYEAALAALEAAEKEGAK